VYEVDEKGLMGMLTNVAANVAAELGLGACGVPGSRIAGVTRTTSRHAGSASAQPYLELSRVMGKTSTARAPGWASRCAMNAAVRAVPASVDTAQQPWDQFFAVLKREVAKLRSACNVKGESHTKSLHLYLYYVTATELPINCQ
jgi:hypothetical protein